MEKLLDSDKPENNEAGFKLCEVCLSKYPEYKIDINYMSN